MPRQIPDTEFEIILRIVANHPSGATLQEILKATGGEFSTRTLQRRIDQLVLEKRLVSSGQGRARRHTIPEQVEPPPEESKQSWLSSESEQIQKQVHLPLTQRNPVGYQSSFLDAYVPNHTSYLSPKLTEKLEKLGQVGLSDLPAGTYLRQVMDRLLIDLSWNSSRLEGNTYSLLETQRLLELGQGVEGKSAQETQMILNHKAAIEMLADRAEGIGFNRYTVCNLHAILADNLLADPYAGGRVRSRPVGISGTVFYPLEVPQQINEQFDLILTKAEAIRNPMEQAFFIMVHLPYLQPFEDVNKRVSRLAANIPLIRYNLCPLSFIDVEKEDYIAATIGVYELNRVEYLRDVFAWAYARSSARYAAIRQSLGEPDPFRLRYRTKIAELVRQVVNGRMDKLTATQLISDESRRTLPSTDQAKFIEVVETELSTLHEGNFARYRLLPKDFALWQDTWK